MVDKDGKEMGYHKVLKAIETQASFMDSVTIPESTNSGMYKVYAKIGDYEKLDEKIVASFHVVGKKEDLFSRCWQIMNVIALFIFFVFFKDVMVEDICSG